MKKINGKKKLLFHCFIVSLFVILVYSRFVGLDWGLPYPMHPDERNMVAAIQQLNCKFSSASWRINFLNCLNPHFFAYGQFPLYLGYLISYFLKIEATISLRIISAAASIINTIIIIKIIKVISKKESYLTFFTSYLLVIFSPFAIQFAHFGTTESLLMFFYSAIIFQSLLFIDKRISTLSFVINSSLLVGLSLTTKVSSLIFLTVPFSVSLFNIEFLKQKTSMSISKNTLYFFGYRLMNKLIDLIILVFISFVVFFIFSPHNFINFKDFISSMNYESDVALGKSSVFYTRQFFEKKPIIFQVEKIFPYALGWPMYILGSLGFLGLSWKDKSFNLLRFAFLVYFIPSAIIYAKWSRFMAPVLPLALIFATIFLLQIKVTNIIKVIIIIFAIIPGIAYLSVYQNPDVRFQASDWIYKNIPNNSYVLSETANVVDIPIELESYKVRKVYKVISFNFYDLDESPLLQQELREHLEKADFIFIASRRIFTDHPKEKYPILNKYYEDLFSGKLGFEKVSEFESFPKVCLPTTDKCLVFDDEQAEETWTVFDHPVIRIYKRKSL